MASLLILGLGWTGEFLAELLDSKETHIPYAATTRDGRHHTIRWTLGDHPSDVDVSLLPIAQTVIVTFPVLNPNLMKALITAYDHKAGRPHWILLSSTRPFTAPKNDRHTPLDRSQDPARIPAEDVVLARQGSVLHLAGLWGKERQPKGWVPLFKTTDALKTKLLKRQLYLIHGKDVARALLATHLGVHGHPQLGGQRWILTDRGFYDWLRLFSAWASRDQIHGLKSLLDHDPKVQQKWGCGQTVDGLIQKGGLQLGLDSAEFWDTFNLVPHEFLAVD